MKEYIATLIIGILFFIIGIFNRRGNISFLHKHHRKRVSEEDRLPFGKMIGNGMFCIGGSMAMQGVLSLIGYLTNTSLLITIGMVVLIAGFVVGLVIVFYAMFKYNKGIF